jgi:hypothetical protein
MSERKIAKIATKTSLKGEGSDVSYWLSRPPAERLAALEEIRQEYNRWKYSDAEQRFQRVYRIVKLKRG